MSQSLLSKELVEVAQARLDGSLHREANLRRATSDLYYAMFHAICEALVELFEVVPESEAYKSAMRSLYRTVEHGYVERRCRKIIEEGKFSSPLLDFAKQLVSLKNKREEADYDPLETFAIREVKKDLQITETRLAAFWAADPAERAAFAFILGLRRGK